MNTRPLMHALLLLAGSIGLAQAQERPKDIVAERTDAVLKTLVEKREQFQADSQALDRFVEGELDRIFDREYSARLVLGRHSRGADPEQISAFAEALTQNLLRKYGAALLDADPSIDVKVLQETELRDGQMIRVATEIHRRGGAPVPVDYMFRAGDGSWKAFDVIVEGVSYVQTYRTQFDEQLRNQTLQQVTDRLRRGEIDVES